MCYDRFVQEYHYVSKFELEMKRNCTSNWKWLLGSALVKVRISEMGIESAKVVPSRLQLCNRYACVWERESVIAFSTE